MISTDLYDKLNQIGYEKTMKTLTSFTAPEKSKFMFQNTLQGPVLWIVSDEGKQKLFRFRGKTIRDKDKKFKHMKYYLEEV